MNHESLKVTENICASDGAKKLIWNVFFESRQRGISLDFHFPWLDDGKQVACLTIDETKFGASQTWAALIIKKQHVDGLGEIGLVGMVCVDPAHRGQGLSTRLMQSAEAYAKKTALKALVLWTTKPAVYEKAGYTKDSQDLYGTVCKSRAGSVRQTAASVKTGIRQMHHHSGGVPAFAEEVIQFSTTVASVTICKSRQSTTLAEWSGGINDTLSLIEHMLPEAWQLNAPQNALLIPALQKHGYTFDLRPGALRMIRRISLPKAAQIPYITILQRI